VKVLLSGGGGGGGRVLVSWFVGRQPNSSGFIYICAVVWPTVQSAHQGVSHFGPQEASNLRSESGGSDGQALRISGRCECRYRVPAAVPAVT
jgi:hypothetical protein